MSLKVSSTSVTLNLEQMKAPGRIPQLSDRSPQREKTNTRHSTFNGKLTAPAEGSSIFSPPGSVENSPVWVRYPTRQ